MSVHGTECPHGNFGSCQLCAEDLKDDIAILRTRNEALEGQAAQARKHLDWQGITPFETWEEYAGRLEILIGNAAESIAMPAAAPTKHADPCSYPECACSCGAQPTPTGDALRLAAQQLVWQIEAEGGHGFTVHGLVNKLKAALAALPESQWPAKGEEGE